MDFEPFRKIARLSRPIIVTEKIDGTSAVIGISQPGAIPSGENIPLKSIETPDGPVSIYAGSRSRWVYPSKSADNYGFAAWVSENLEDLMNLGPGRHYGEWWGRGINRGYGLDHRRFSLFNVSRWSGENRGGAPACCSTVPILYEGEFSSSAICDCLEYLDQFGSMAAPGFENPEGVVVFHAAGNILFKKTLVDDEAPKSSQEAA